jgi:hypothetical protein
VDVALSTGPMHRAGLERTPPRGRVRWWVWILLAALLAVRLPSLAQPAGGDQGLYAYVGDRILQGDLPYRDAWDQKPPAVHYTYALLLALSRDDAVVAAADLAAAAGVAVLLVAIGRALVPWPGAGEAAAVLCLLLGNPAFTRLGGVRVRAQCETFIALAVAGALLAAIRSGHLAGTSRASRRPSGLPPGSCAAAAAGLLIGIATLYKYNAIVYAALPPAAWLAARGLRRIERHVALGHLAAFALALAAPGLAIAGLFAAGGALDDWYQATVAYNLRYSGGTYDGPAGFIAYLVTFPIAQARLDPLWMLGGLGCLVLGASALRRPASAVPVVWVAAACLAIAVNGSRNLPQYFMQAPPALALAAGAAGALAWTSFRARGRTAVALLLAAALSRNTTFAKVTEYTRHDLQYLSGAIDRRTYLAKFGGREGDKFSALAVHELGAYLAARTDPQDRVFVFGFSGWSYVAARRESASRFFWSYPVISGFNAGRPGYGPEGMLRELEAARPRYVVLQRHDWDPDGPDSETFALAHPGISAWLRREYRRQDPVADYAIWSRGTTP